MWVTQVPLPLLFSHKKQGPHRQWQCGNQQQMNRDIWGWWVMDNNKVSSILPLPLSYLHRRSRSHIAVSDMAAIQLQTTTTTHHNNHATSHNIMNHHEDPTAPPHWMQTHTNKANCTQTETTTHQQRRMPMLEISLAGYNWLVFWLSCNTGLNRSCNRLPSNQGIERVLVRL